MLESRTSTQVRDAEAPLLAAGVPLMERASFALAVRVAGELRRTRGAVTGARAVVLVGPGNNGGDALHAGALLARRGVGVQAVCVTERVHAEGAAALARAGGRSSRLEGAGDGDGPALAVAEAVALAAGADVVLDGLLGIGARGPLRGAAASLVGPLAAELRSRRDAGAATPAVVAVDVPSGIGVDDGSLAGPVLPADVTVTFGAPKPGLLLPPAAHLAGRVEVVDLGLALEGPPAVARLAPEDVAALWPRPTSALHKYTRGVLGVVAGSRTYPGAAVLTADAAVAAGVGMVRYLGDAAEQVLSRSPEVVPGPGRVQAWVLGPGVAADDAGQRVRIERALEGVQARGELAVVDAGALELLPERVGPHVVLTPHAGELAWLLSARGTRVERAEVEAEPVRWAERAHALTGATVLLKGAVTVVVGAQGAVYAQADGPAWLATAGAGDVLAGVLGAALAGSVEAMHDDPSLTAALAAAAALVHGRAAHAANPGGPVRAGAVARAVPGVLAGLLGTPA